MLWRAGCLRIFSPHEKGLAPPQVATQRRFESERGWTSHSICSSASATLKCVCRRRVVPTESRCWLHARNAGFVTREYASRRIYELVDPNAPGTHSDSGSWPEAGSTFGQTVNVPPDTIIWFAIGRAENARGRVIQPLRWREPGERRRSEENTNVRPARPFRVSVLLPLLGGGEVRRDSIVQSEFHPQVRILRQNLGLHLGC